MLYCTLADLLRGQLSRRLPLPQCDQIILLINSQYRNNLMFIIYICTIPFTNLCFIRQTSVSLTLLEILFCFTFLTPYLCFQQYFLFLFFYHFYKIFVAGVCIIFFAKFPLTKRLCLKLRLLIIMYLCNLIK